ncbi:MAG: exodeoxyribonuclease VII small subunit [Alysiella sp.]|uniref:exodeoxyribonuclease VII small subunit n=1 Tax=Alysiella sp. TaxID=1872483 RepID=UPI0026DB72C5|nr:exodeoxyribonuclease VII small subunit [Alysiella sp.]MDO4434483.1 exodeoxyribonuclease VII small subunit [Alysiella sp.]
MSRKTAPKTFEEAITRLEEITQAMQSNHFPLEDALAAYEEGTKLVRFCQEKLAQVEQKLAVLENGELKEWQADE